VISIGVQSSSITGSSEPRYPAADAGSLRGMHPRYRRLVIPGVLIVLMTIVVLAAALD
jgi:hypothetical protein